VKFVDVSQKHIRELKHFLLNIRRKPSPTA
jgi:hypothetical protein